MLLETFQVLDGNARIEAVAAFLEDVLAVAGVLFVQWESTAGSARIGQSLSISLVVVSPLRLGNFAPLDSAFWAAFRNDSWEVLRTFFWLVIALWGPLLIQKSLV